jgi:hypothetical protein
MDISRDILNGYMYWIIMEKMDMKRITIIKLFESNLEIYMMDILNRCTNGYNWIQLDINGYVIWISS